MAVCAIEYGVDRRSPLRTGRELRPVGVYAQSLEIALGGFILIHGGELEIRLFGNDDDLRERRNRCMRPSAGDLKTQKKSIGHQLRTRAGTAIGTVSVRSV